MRSLIIKSKIAAGESTQGMCSICENMPLFMCIYLYIYIYIHKDVCTYIYIHAYSLGICLPFLGVWKQKHA